MANRGAWWLRYPQVWDKERTALDEASLPFSVKDCSTAEGPVRTVSVLWERDWGGEGPLTLRGVYPGAYPWFPPQVFAPQLRRLTHHVAPNGQVCLLGSEDLWAPSHTLAGVLTRQLPLVLSAGAAAADANQVADLEVHVPEPRQFPYAQGAVVLVRPSFTLPAGRSGGLLLRGHQLKGLWHQHAVVLAAEGDELVVPARSKASRGGGWESDGAPPGLTRAVVGGWVRLSRPPASRTSAHALFERLHARLPAALRARLECESTSVILASFPDEVAWRRKGPALLAVVRRRRGSREPGYWHVRVMPTGMELLRSRAPETAPAEAARAVVVGAGALGGPAAFELARSGVGHLVVIDGDVVEPVNAVRQLPGLASSGLPKALAVELAIERHVPHVAVTGVDLALGAHPEALQEQLLLLIAQAAVVCDLTASPVVTRYLAAHCRAAGTPLVVGSATNGAWGGTVVVLKPSVEAACWQCVELHRRDGTVPAPPEAPYMEHPDGCSSPSFTGTAFDLAAVWQHVVRVTFGELGRSARCAYPPMGDENVYVVSLRDEEGRPVPAQWRQLRLDVHPGCPRHPPTGASAAAVPPSSPSPGATG